MKRLKIISISLILITVLTIGGSIVANGAQNQKLPETLVQGFDPNFPPYTWINEQGKATGFDIEVVNWIAKHQGFKVKHEPTSWDGIVLALTRGKIDFIASGLGMDPERAKRVRYTIPYDWYSQQILVRKDSGLTVEDLKGGKKQKIAYQSGAGSAEKWVNKLIKDWGWNMKKLALGSYSAAARTVSSGRADAFLSDSGWTRSNLEKKQFSNLKILTQIGPKYGYAYAVRQGDQAILNALNEGLNHIMGTKKWKELKQKYNMTSQ